MRFWTKIMRNKEIKNAGWLIAGKVIQMILSFLLSIFTARYLGPSNYGLINYAGAYVAFFSSICTLGINSVIIKDFVDNPEEQGEAIGSTLVLRALSSMFSGLMIVGIVSIVDYGEILTIEVAALCSLSLLFHIFDTLNYWFQSQYKSKVTAIATLLAYLATSAYKIVLLILQKGVVWFAFATSVDYIFVAVFLYLAYKNKKGPKMSFSMKKGKSLLSKSYHYILSGLMVAVYSQTDKLMLKQMLDEKSVGYYSLAFSVNLMWVFVLQAIIDSIYPTIMTLYKKGDINGFERKNRQLYAIIAYTSLCAGLFFMLFGRFILIKLYGMEYEASSGPLKIITWYTVFSYLGVARNAWVVCTNNQKYLKYIYLSAAVINIGLNAVFIPLWGPSGAALSSLLTQVLTSMVLPCFIKNMRPNVKLMLEAVLLKGIR